MGMDKPTTCLARWGQIGYWLYDGQTTVSPPVVMVDHDHVLAADRFRIDEAAGEEPTFWRSSRAAAAFHFGLVGLRQA